jgi:hypothetical protein
MPVVKAGDTLSAIAAANNTTVAKIVAANPQITNPNLIKPGQVITLPAAKATTPTVNTTTAAGVAAASGVVPNFTPTITYPTTPSTSFVGPIPVGTTRTSTGYTTTVASADPNATTTWKKAGTVQTKNGPVDVDANGKAADGSIPVADSSSTPTGSPGRAWIWNGTNWVQPPKPDSNNYTWDNNAGWVLAQAGLSQAEVDAQIKAAVAGALTQFQADQKAANQANVSTALDDFRASLKLAGLDALVDTIDGYIKQDMTAAQIKINLVSSDAYIARFPAMKTLASKGRAVNEATYISMERGYEQVLRAYGVDTATFGSRTELGKYIGAEVSPVEFEQRVQIAKDRVDKNTDVTAALQDYYGVTKGGAIAFLLNPELGMDIVKKEARAAEIGAAATAAGFGEFAGKANVGVAESFVNASGTQDLMSLKAEFGKARNLANTQGNLAAIEGDKTYKDLNAVTAIIGQDTQELLQSQRRAAREAARFGGSSGLSAQSLRANQVGI